MASRVGRLTVSPVPRVARQLVAVARQLVTTARQLVTTARQLVATARQLALGASRVLAALAIALTVARGLARGRWVVVGEPVEALPELIEQLGWPARAADII